MSPCPSQSPQRAYCDSMPCEPLHRMWECCDIASESCDECEPGAIYIRLAGNFTSEVCSNIHSMTESKENSCNSAYHHNEDLYPSSAMTLIKAALTMSSQGPFCIVGLHTGHEVLALLASQPSADIIIFEQHFTQYMGIAFIKIQGLFPQASLQLIRVGEGQSISETIEAHASLECSIIFINGNEHEPASLIKHMRALAAPTEHILIVDNVSQSASVQKVWLTAQLNEVVEETAELNELLLPPSAQRFSIAQVTQPVAGAVGVRISAAFTNMAVGRYSNRSSFTPLQQRQCQPDESYAAIPAAYGKLCKRVPGTKATPRYVHHIYSGGCQEMSYMAYLHTAAVLDVIKPDILFVHYTCEPTGPYWPILKHHLTLIQQPDFHEVAGNVIAYKAHKADVMRLKALLKYGGLYLDLDILPLKSFDALYNTGRVVQGVEFGTQLCNAVLMAPAKHRYISDWLDDYATFNESEWAEHSTIRPSSRAFATDEVCKMPASAFYGLLHDAGPLAELFESVSAEHAAVLSKDAYAIHLWNAMNTTHHQTLNHAEWFRTNPNGWYGRAVAALNTSAYPNVMTAFTVKGDTQ
eukprot:12389-Heterococcus_DN1.PRE.2